MFTLLKKSDARQVRKVLAGHREAFDPLVERYLPAVYAVAYAHTGNHADAEDVAQEAFLSAFQSLHTLREPAKFEGWVVSITRRAAAKLRERKPGQETMGAPVMNASTTPDPARQELRRLLREEIEQLEEEPREVLLLHYFAGKSAAEIADTLSISREAAKKRLQRARQTLSDNLLAAIHEETPPATGYRKQRTAIMGLVGATTVAWGSGAAAATTAGLWAWIPGGTTGLAAGVAIVAVVAGGVYTVLHDEGPGDDGGVSVAAMNTEALPADGMAVVESPPVPTVPSLPEDLPEAGSEAAAGEAPSLAGLWRACDNRGVLKDAFGPGGDFMLVTQTGEDIAIHSSGAVFGAGEELASGEIQGDRIAVTIPGARGDAVLSGTLEEGASIVLSGSMPSRAGDVEVDITLTRLNDREVAEAEIWGKRQHEVRQLASALAAYFKEHDNTFPDRLEMLNDGYLENPQLTLSSGSRLITYNPYGPSDVDMSGYPPELTAVQRLLRKEEDALRAWPDFPAPMPRLRIDYAAPPMVLQFVNTNPDAVYRTDKNNRLACPEVAEKRAVQGEENSLVLSCQNNLKQLGLVMKMFSNEAQEERYPPGWAVVYPEYLTDLNVLTCPSLGEDDETPDRTVSYEVLFPAANEADLQALAAEWGLVDASDPRFQSAVPMVIETHDCADGKSRNVLFLDGHVEKYKAARWESEIAPFLAMAERYRSGL